MDLKDYKGLKANNWRFTYEKDGAKLYQRSSKPILAFLEDECEPADDYVTKADLLAAYNKYARENGLQLATSMIAFGREIKDQTVIPVETKKPLIGDKQVEVWYGIKLKNKNGYQ